MTKNTKDNERYMRRAIALALRGRGYTSPNPMVGAVIVKDGEIIGEGYHRRYGELHAERNALADCREDPSGADLYVTLEPCCHHGKTPPCTEAIIESGIGHVFVGSADPNPKVAGGGIRQLQEAGISVTEDVMREECDAINPAFFHYIQSGRPYVTWKYAMTADGKIATRTGASKWITGEEARTDVHRLRHENAAIMVGIGTVLFDDPMLNCRLNEAAEKLAAEAKDPVRIICDTHLRIPTSARIVKSAGDIRTILACGTGEAEKQKEKASTLRRAGCEIWELGTSPSAGKIKERELIDRLGKEHLDSVLIEGGGTLAWSMLSQKLVNRVVCYMAPKIFGGSLAKTPVEGSGFDAPDQATIMELREMTRLGRDIKLVYAVVDA